jgi:hypothetical protein
MSLLQLKQLTAWLSKDHHHQNQSINRNRTCALIKHIIFKEIEQEIVKRGKHPARRWVVERTNSWHNRFRKLFTRYEKKEENYLTLVKLANSIIIYRRIILG